MGLKEQFIAGMEKGLIPQHLAHTFIELYGSYLREGAKGGYTPEQLDAHISEYLRLVLEQVAHPYQFDIFHKQVRAPIDYYRFAIEFMRPLVDFSRSKVHGKEHLDAIQKSLKSGENVILLSNHQIEPDPQAINLMLEKTHPELASNMIFVAGHRVIKDPVAIPFSKGVNLLCIFSKNYIENPPEEKHDKLMHNRRTMQKMVELLNEGGKCIYVAPSGGRDRPDARGNLHVSPFDANSIEMFRLMTNQSERPTHYHTLALATHALQPPPSTIEKQLGEQRIVNFTPIQLAFGKRIDMEGCIPPGLDKASARKERALLIWNQVQNDYAAITR